MLARFQCLLCHQKMKLIGNTEMNRPSTGICKHFFIRKIGFCNTGFKGKGFGFFGA